MQKADLLFLLKARVEREVRYQEKGNARIIGRNTKNGNFRDKKHTYY